jgi:hypothetical protein
VREVTLRAITTPPPPLHTHTPIPTPRYYGNATDKVKLLFFDMLCQSRMPPVGYAWLRSLGDMVTPLDPAHCTGTVPASGRENVRESNPLLLAKTAGEVGASRSTRRSPGAGQGTSGPGHMSLAVGQEEAPGVGQGGILFSIMSISDLFGHVNPRPYNATYFESLWRVLDPIVAQLNASGELAHAVVYGFDEAHPKTVYEPLVAQLFGAVKQRYNGRLATMATLHYCPSLDSPIDVLVQSYASYPNGTDHPANYGKPGAPGQYCEPNFPKQWEASAPGRRKYFFYHCFSPRSPDDGNNPWEPKYGAMNTFVNYPFSNSRLMPWWAAANEGVSGWLYFEVSEWKFDTGPSYPHPEPYHNHSMAMPWLPPFVRQPNDGFIEERVGGHQSETAWTGGSRLTFNVNKYYSNVYGGGTTAGDGVFVYPGRDGPVAGARMENWRDGSEDIEIFARLPASSRLLFIHRLVRSIGEWEINATLLEQTRREAAEELVRLAEAV